MPPLEGRRCGRQDVGGQSIGFHRVREHLRKALNSRSMVSICALVT